MSKGIQIKVKNVHLPRSIFKLPREFEREVLDRAGGYRVQKYIIEDVEQEWTRLADKHFNKRQSMGLPVTGRFRKALVATPRKYTIIFNVKEIKNRGFDYTKALMYGRRGAKNMRYVRKLDRLVHGGKHKRTTKRKFNLMMKDLDTFCKSQNRRRKWVLRAVNDFRRIKKL